MNLKFTRGPGYEGLPSFITTVPTAGLVKSAIDIALRHGRSMYDSIYVALAVASKCALVTADEKLVNALATYLPVRWLGAI
jgi:predicted nucleic acid-binding protein